MDEESAIQKSIAERLVSALRQGEFVLYAQAIMPLAPVAGERPFQEILVRFREEEEKLLPPGSIFPLLEEYHLLPFVDRWVVSRLAKWIQDARTRDPGWLVPCSGINLSTDTLDDAGFGEFTGRHIQNARLPVAALIFEITWDIATRNAEQVRTLRTQLKPAGCRFTLAGFDGSDDSFEFVEDIAPDFVKFSYGVVKDIDPADPVPEKVKSVARERLESINRKCQSQGIRTIAEYVESRAALERLRLMEVDFAQGLEISSPRPLT